MHILKSLVWSEWGPITLSSNTPTETLSQLYNRGTLSTLKKTLLFYFKWFQLLGRTDICPFLYHLTDNTVTGLDYMINTASVLQEAVLFVGTCPTGVFDGDCVAHLLSFLSWLVFSWFVILRFVSCMNIVASVSGLSIIEWLFVFLKALFNKQ